MMDISQYIQDPVMRQALMSAIQRRQQTGAAITPGEAAASPTGGMGLMDIMKNGGGMGLLGMLAKGGGPMGLMQMLGGGMGKPKVPAVPHDVTMTQPM